MKLQKISSAIIVASLVLPVLAGAQFLDRPSGERFTIGDVLRILNLFVSWIFSIFLIVAVIFLLIAAFQYLTSGGDPTRVGAATRSVIYAAVAIAVALLSASLEFIVRELIGVR